MLDLGGPSTIYNGLSVFSDYANRRQFYYLPPPPRLAVDPASGQRVFKLIKLAGGLVDPAGEALESGLVFFDCDLALTDEELVGLEGHVRQKFGLTSGELQLSPLLYKSGTVEAYVLGEQSWPDDAPPERKNLFVERLQGAGQPSLYGANRAAFCARLTREGSTILEASAAVGGPIGISVVFKLSFDALQPAFKFSVKADWEQIYHYLEEKCGVDLFFFRVESTNLLEELEQKQLLKFEEVAFDPAASGELSQLRKQVQEMILEKFFTPLLSAGEPKTNRIPGMIGDVLRSTVLLPSFGYQRRELTQTERRSFSFDCTRVSAVERTIYPQANLFTLIPPAELASYVQEVNTDADLFYRQLDVQCVIGGVDLHKAKIAWVHPRLRYGHAPEERADKAMTSVSDTLRFRTWVQPGHGFRYRSSYEVAFHPSDDADPETVYGRQLLLSSPEVETADRVLAIAPSELFEVRSVEFAAQAAFPWDRYPGILLEVLYRAEDGYEVAKSYALDAGHAAKTFRVREPRGGAGVTHFRVSHFKASGGKTKPSDWQVVNESLEVLSDPFPPLFSVRVHIAEPAAELGWADVSLEYLGGPPDHQQSERLFFEGPPVAQTWKVNARDPTERRYRYRFSLFLQNGTLLESSDWVETDAPTLTLGRRVPTQRSVSIALGGRSFEAEELRDITVTTWPETEPEGAPGTELSFEAVDQTREFSYRSLDPSRVGYRYEAFYRWTTGRTQTVRGTRPVNALQLVLPTRLS